MAQNADGLTDKQERFCLAYIELDSASEAYRRVYDVADDCDPNTIWSNACQLKSNTKVAQRIGELRKAVAERAEITVERVAKELSRIAFANMDDFTSSDEDGNPRVHLPDDRELMSIVSEVQVDTLRGSKGEALSTERVKFKLYSKLDALEKLGKHLAMFTDKVEQKHDVTDRLAKLAEEIDGLRRSK